jgi:hypothetical protein
MIFKKEDKNMDAKNANLLVDLTAETIGEVDRILSMSGSEYVKEFATESAAVERAKIEKAQIMVSTLKFFIDKFRGAETVSENE